MSIEASSYSIAEATSQHESPEDRSGLTDNLRNDKDDQPAHNQIESQAEFFIDLLSENLIKNAKDGRAPLDSNDEIAKPVIHQRQHDRRVAASDGDVNHRVVNNAQDILVGRAIGHRVIDCRGEEHEKEADDKDRSSDSSHQPVPFIAINS